MLLLGCKGAIRFEEIPVADHCQTVLSALLTRIPMRRCAFLTLEDPTGYVIDDELAYQPLAALGWRVEAIPWRRPRVDWRAYDAVVIRSPWDYTSDPDAFLDVLGEIERSGTALHNALDLVRWNIRKTYLRDLAGRGVPVVPTIWRERLQPNELSDLIAEVGTAEVVIKPVVGANASGAFRLNAQTARDRAGEVSAFYADRALMAQPFLSAITTEGEFSLFYFNGAHSHTISKVPKAADFRVQEEHGGLITAVETNDALRAAGDLVLRAIGEAPLYLRADFVRASNEEGYWLIELELIEPALYLRMDKRSRHLGRRNFEERLLRIRKPTNRGRKALRIRRAKEAISSS